MKELRERWWWRMATLIWDIDPSQRHIAPQSHARCSRFTHCCSGGVALQLAWPAGKICVCLLGRSYHRGLVTSSRTRWKITVFSLRKVVVYLQGRRLHLQVCLLEKTKKKSWMYLVNGWFCFLGHFTLIFLFYTDSYLIIEKQKCLLFVLTEFYIKNVWRSSNTLKRN